MGSIFSPKMPAIPQMTMPDPADVPSAEDEARKQQEEEELRRRQRNRKGRRSTILTDASMEDTEADIKKTTLLGG